MERPAKRMRISNPEIRNPRDTGSRMTEGLFTSELGIQGDDQERTIRPTRTISLSDFQRRDIYGKYQRVPRQVLPRGNQGIYLRPRAPDATVTASVVEINVNDGTSVSKVTEVTAAPSGTIVSLPNVGSATVSVSVPGLTGTTDSTTGTVTDSSMHITSTTSRISSSTTPADGSTTTSSEVSTTGSLLSEGPTNGTTILPDSTSSSERTVTVTATSTYEISLINGTYITPEATFFITGTSSGLGTESGTIHTITASESVSTSATFTFGDLTSIPSSTDNASASESAAASTGYYPGGAAQTGSPTESSASAASSSSSSDSGSGGGDGPGLSPSQQQVVGGVVGGVAGVAIVLLILLVVLRWYRGRLKGRGQLPEQIAARQLGGDSGHSYPMSQRSSNVPFAAAVAYNLKKLRPHSTQTIATTATAATDPSVKDSERGFQRIAGRKIAPVLGSGGDPYGGNYGAFEKDTLAGPSDPLSNQDRGLSGASFYRDSGGFYGGPGNQSPTFPPSPTTAAMSRRAGDFASSPSGPASSARDFADTASLSTPSRPEGYAVMRPSPARTPVTLSPAASSIRLPIQPPPTMDDDAPPLPTGLLVPGQIQRDGVGRSLASQDGSRVSRSSGRSGARFIENM
ncbi:hypothetical protein LTR67_006895 [Exophiala xenobiotica]